MKRLASVFLAFIIMISILFVPAQAAPYTISSDTVEITTNLGSYSKTFATSRTRTHADANPITFYIDSESEFPVTVRIAKYNGWWDEYSFSSYGVKHIDWNTRTYATIDFKKRPDPIENTEGTTVEKKLTEEEIIDEKLSKLLNELDLGFYNDAYTPYGKELRAFLTGEWDGTYRAGNPKNAYGGYIASRTIRSRTYSWEATNLYSGEFISKKVNVDYIGYDEVIPGLTYSQDFSLAVSRRKGTIEQWHFLEKIDSWQLPLTESAEYIYDIIALGTDKTARQAIVYTFDTEKQSHIYSLMPGGVVEKLT